MASEDELRQILNEARASNVDPRWIEWLEELVREVRRLQEELDRLTQNGTDDLPSDDTKVL